MKGKKFWSFFVCSAGILHDRMSSNKNKEETGLEAVILKLKKKTIRVTAQG